MMTTARRESLLVWITVVLAAAPCRAQLPVIDMHVHGTNTPPAAIATRLAENKLRYVFLAGLASDIEKWNQTIDPSRLITGLTFPCPAGRHTHTGRDCFPGKRDFPDLLWLREQVQSKRIRAFGEISLQYMGIRPDDARMEPYWKMAEEFDLPVGIHMSSGPPGIAFEAKLTALTAPEYRMSMGDPLLLEEVLLRHKNLRLFVMHAGWPRLESTIALLSMYPNVYVDIAALSAPMVVPRVSYLKYLRELVENGFGKRIMFGTDFPSEVERGVAIIVQAEFLNQEQKSDILCGNAARFLKLDASICNGNHPVAR
jgi:hypothetical protein